MELKTTWNLSTRKDSKKLQKNGPLRTNVVVEMITYFAT